MQKWETRDKALSPCVMVAAVGRGAPLWLGGHLCWSQPLGSVTSQLTECQPEPVGIEVPFSVGEAGSVVTVCPARPLLDRPLLRLQCPFPIWLGAA